MKSDTIPCFSSICRSQQQLNSSTTVHTAFGFLIMMLLTLIQVRFQNSDNPFHTNGGIMFSFIGCALGYSITLAWISQPTLNTSYLHIGRSVCVIFGTFASGLLVEILLPPLGFFILAICALMLARLLCVSHQEILQCFQEIFQSINQYTSEAFKTLCGWVQNGFQSLKQAASRAFNSSSMPTAHSLEEQAETVGTSA
ncbi:hypothetical protein ACJW31_09G155100 [Castanea mollissima]